MLLDDNFEMQGGVRNYLGKTQEVTAPKFWQSSKDSPPTELTYITEAEKSLLLDANLHGSLDNGKPNIGASGLLSLDGWGDATAGGGMDTSGGNAGAEGGQGDGSGGYNAGNNNNTGNINDEFGTDGNVYAGTNINTSSGNNDPQLPPGVTSNNFDYETEAYTGVGKIESNFYNDETGEFTTTQSPGVIPAVDYQTSNIGAYLDNPNVPDKDKTDFLGRLKAISNSDLVGTNIDGIEDQFVIDNLDGSLNSIIDQTKYSKYTSNIDEVAKTFESDLKNTPLSTIAKSGGLIGTFFRGVTDNYKNNKAMDLLGYTGSTIKYNPDGSGDFNYGGGFLTGNASEGERDAVNQLTPLAADAIGGTTTQPSMVNEYFNNLNNTNLGISENYLNTYNTAKTKMANTLNMTPPNQQFGYGNTYNDTYARKMNNTNVFYNYLNEQGLI
jgi:hypothetical protein